MVEMVGLCVQFFFDVPMLFHWTLFFSLYVIIPLTLNNYSEIYSLRRILTAKLLNVLL